MTVTSIADETLESHAKTTEQAAPLTAQRDWARQPLQVRLKVLRRARSFFAEARESLLDALSGNPSRNRADSLASEVLPLLAACQFLEREAEEILRTRLLGRKGRPFWLSGVQSSVERVPLGTVLIVGPANYPLFLPGVQALQAFAAGNAVIWKPGRGGRPVAEVFAGILQKAGLPQGLMQVTDESIEAVSDAICRGVDKMFFTGSSRAGRSVLALAAETATAVVAELSGCDAVFVLAGAETARVVDALAFGMRLNGSATCMAPRRLMLVGPGHEPLLRDLRERFASMSAVALTLSTLNDLRDLVEDAAAAGASVFGDLRSEQVAPILVMEVKPEMRLAQADIFAPVLSVLQFPDEAAALEADRLCPYGLTAAIFGDESQARKFGEHLTVGTVLINDVIVPSADPRVPFGGRRASGFGSTRGTEGLLEMTTPRTVLVRRGRDTRHLQPTGADHERLFAGVLSATHAAGWRARLAGFKQIISAVRHMEAPRTAQNKTGSKV